jgi:lysozyme
MGSEMPDALARAVTNTDPKSIVTAYSERHAKPWVISDEGVKFLEGWEAFSASMYDNDGSKVGNATIGYGHLVHLGKISDAASEKPFQKGITQAEASELLKKDLTWVEKMINERIKVPLFQFEYDALACFMYNLQHHGDRVLDFVNTGEYNKVGDKMRQYATVKGHLVKGLKRRRHREAEMFEAGVYDSSH